MQRPEYVSPSKQQVMGQFILDLTKDKLDLQTRDSMGFGCDLEYSADEESHNSILRELKQEEEQQQRQTQARVQPQPIQSTAVQPKQEQKKRERKAIFDKYKPSEPKNINLMNKFDEIFLQRQSLRSKVTMGTTTPIQSPLVQPSSISNVDPRTVNMKKQEETEDSIEFMEPTEQQRLQHALIAGGDSPKKQPHKGPAKQQQMNESFRFDIKENDSMMSDRFSRIYGSNQNMFLDSRDSKQIVQDLLNEDIFKGDIDVNDSLRMSVQIEQAFKKNVVVSAIAPANKKQEPKPTSTIESGTISGLAPTTSKLIRNTIVGVLSMRSESIRSTQFMQGSNISGISEALGKLKEFEFEEPLTDYRICDLLKQSWRLNSFSFNFSLPVPLFNVVSLRHKQVLRDLSLEQIIELETMLMITEEIIQRKRLFDSLITNFRPEVFRQGDWYRYTIKNLEKIKPSSPHVLRNVDVYVVKQALRKTLETTKKVSEYVQIYKLQRTPESKTMYINLRKTIDDIEQNLKKISEDLYYLGVQRSLPLHYYMFYEYLAKPTTDNPDLQPEAIQELIDERQSILGTLQVLRNAHDPLSCSNIKDDIENKGTRQINRLKARYFNLIRLRAAPAPSAPPVRP